MVSEVYFVPGQLPRERAPSGGLSWIGPWPGEVARLLAERYTRPGELVLMPFCHSPTPVREAVAAGRRVVAGNTHPLIRLALQVALDPLPGRELLAAFTRLGDSLKRGRPVRELLSQLYRSRCPACGRETPASYFLWAREPADPRQKWIDCRGCGAVALYPVDADDLALLDEVETRGLHYHYLLDRTAAVGDPLRQRAEEWLELYTPRNLYVIAEILLKIESLFPAGATQTALKVALLRCLEQASNLFGEPDPAEPPTGLRPPARFIEHNVWQMFSNAVERLAGASETPPVALYPDLPALLGEAAPGVYLHSESTAALARQLPARPGRVTLTVAAPPVANAVFWALSYLWAGWLLGPKATASLKRLVTQPWPDWAWYQAALAASLRALRPALAPTARWVFAFQETNPRQSEALALAALSAGFEVEAWLLAAPDRHQLILRPAPLDAPPPVDLEALARRIREEAGKAALKVLAGWAEPLTGRQLRLAAWRRIVARGWAARALASTPGDRALNWVNEVVAAGLGRVLAESGRIVEIEGDEKRAVAWWLVEAHQRRWFSSRSEAAGRALTDRVEAAVLAALRPGQTRSTSEVAHEVNRQFPGALTPPAGLVEVCLRAYGLADEDDKWRLNPGETEMAWEARIDEFGRVLTHLGERLNFRVDYDPATLAVIWREAAPGESPWADYRLRLTAEITELLSFFRASASNPASAAQTRYLVIPAARASLWRFKLRAMPWLPELLAAGGWTFIKWQHLQSLAAQEAVTRHDFKAISGLEPLIEQAAGQMPLF